MEKTRLAAALAILFSTASAVMAQPVPTSGLSDVKPSDVVVLGHATIGKETRSIRISFSCSAGSNGAVGSLQTALWVPHAGDLAHVFPFDEFEGPYAHAGAQTGIEVKGPNGTQGGMFEAAGWYGVGQDNPFAFGVNAMVRKGDRKLGALADILRPLTIQSDAPVRFTWFQRSANPSGPTLTATADIPNDLPESADRLHAVLAPCLSVAASGASRSR